MPAPVVTSIQPSPFVRQPEPQPSAPAPTASPAPFSSFLSASKPKESQESTFIPFIPQTPKEATGPVIKPVPASPTAPIALEVAPKTAPAQTVTCSNCGKTISGRWKFCTYCGLSLK